MFESSDERDDRRAYTLPPNLPLSLLPVLGSPPMPPRLMVYSESTKRADSLSGRRETLVSMMPGLGGRGSRGGDDGGSSSTAACVGQWPTPAVDVVTLLPYYLACKPSVCLRELLLSHVCFRNP